jgi:hypothetical protein
MSQTNGLDIPNSPSQDMVPRRIDQKPTCIIQVESHTQQDIDKERERDFTEIKPVRDRP